MIVCTPFRLPSQNSPALRSTGYSNATASAAYLTGESEEHVQKAFYFCNEFGQASVKLESFFKGFLYLLALQYVESRDYMDNQLKKYSDDFDFFISALKMETLFGTN